jgi:hypothetical protein
MARGLVSGGFAVQSRRTGGFAWCPPSFADGRFVVDRTLSDSSGQGYLLAVTDTETGAPGILKGLWWNAASLAGGAKEYDRRRAILRAGVAAVTAASRSGAAVPGVVSFFTEVSPTRVREGALTHAGGKADHEPFVVSRLVQDGDAPALTLEDEIADRWRTGRPFSPAELLDLAEQLCAVLAGLHEQPDGTIVHGDLKPANILVVGEPAQYVTIDFDSVVRIPPRAKGPLVDHGTPEYAPPGREPAAPAYDVYCWATTLLHAATGRLPDAGLKRRLYDAEKAADWVAARSEVAALGLGQVLARLVTDSMGPVEWRLSRARALALELRRARQAVAFDEVLTGVSA